MTDKLSQVRASIRQSLTLLQVYDLTPEQNIEISKTIVDLFEKNPELLERFPDLVCDIIFFESESPELLDDGLERLGTKVFPDHWKKYPLLRRAQFHLIIEAAENEPLHESGWDTISLWLYYLEHVASLEPDLISDDLKHSLILTQKSLSPGATDVDLPDIRDRTLNETDIEKINKLDENARKSYLRIIKKILSARPLDGPSPSEPAI
jgi:hypothetical protein